tara:strand:- start:59 stop:391 length:333 start_codon:yes stop_codon:yes gene_type:complete
LSEKKGMKWPICSAIILSVLLGLGYITLNKYQNTPSGVKTEKMISTPTTGLNNNYRSSLSKEFIFIFGIIMLIIMSTIIYLWWSLKDWEGGKKYGEEDLEETEDKISDKA